MRMHIKALLLALLGCSVATLASADDVYNKAVKATPVLSTSVNSIGQAIRYPQTDKAQVSMLHVELPPGAQTGWHSHPVPGFAYVIAGTLTIEIEGGKQVQFSAGQGFAEVVNTLHNGKNFGTEPVKLIVVFAGEEGKPFTVKAAK